jgi:3D-(3,5/4)-trihydroxycyclohexane-1,2-dione acylhydrolase (decyclizing)
VSINVNAMDAHKHGAVPVVADAQAALQALDAALTGARFDGTRIESARAAWLDARASLVARATEARAAPPSASAASPPALSQAAIIDIVNEHCARAPSLVVHAAGGIPGDIHKLWRSARHDDYHSEYGYSCMGYEIAGALGAKIARPEAEVYALLGDGSYLMLANELLTAIQEHVKITVIVVDNHGYQCIHNLQRGTGGRSFGNEFRARNGAALDGDVVRVDFVQSAQALGATAFTATTASELERALTDARALSTSAFIYVPIAEPSNLPGSSWWDVPPPEVSGVPSVQQARRDYDEARRKQRFHY